MLKRLYYKLIKKSPASMPCVEYWKHKENCAAKVTRAEDGSIIMKMEGEKHPFPTFPRGHLLFGYLSKLKHEIKNQIFNRAWYMLEKGEDEKYIVKLIKTKLYKDIAKIAYPLRYDALPLKSMTPSVREINRAWDVVSPETSVLKDYLCFILQEDDAYRFRVQWMVQWFSKFRSPVDNLKKALEMMEHGEVIGDMKERIRLLRRILLLVLKHSPESFNRLYKEIDWKKVALTEGDKYHFRGKYFKVDYKLFEY